MYKTTHEVICDKCAKRITLKGSQHDEVESLGWEEFMPVEQGDPYTHQCPDCKAAKIRIIKLAFESDFTEQERKRICSVLVEELNKIEPHIAFHIEKEANGQ